VNRQAKNLAMGMLDAGVSRLNQEKRTSGMASLALKSGKSSLGAAK
jgi:hypothetical protein